MSKNRDKTGKDPGETPPERGRMTGTSATPACHTAKAFAQAGRLAPGIGLRAGKVKALSDSLVKLTVRTEVQIRAKADSLQSRLDSLKAKAAGRMAKVEEAAGKITRKIDSVRAGVLQGFGNPGGLRGGGKLKKYGPGLPGADQVSKIDKQIKNIGGFGRSGRYDQYIDRRVDA